MSATPRRVSHATTVRLGHATLAVPAAWWLARTSDRLSLEDPDRQLRVWVLAGTGDAQAAIASAWRRVAPSSAWSPAEAPDSPPPTGGWDEMTTLGYETPKGHGARAEWRRFGQRGWVVLIDGKREALARREAQIETIVGSLHPDGMREETLTGRPRALDAAKIDAFVGRALAALAVPGAAVAVIVDGGVVYERTFGVRVLGESAPVTPNTRFMIGSITKPMTTLMQAALVDAGMVRWDSLVTTLLPGFALGDATITAQLRLWHMSCACTGMPRQDLEDIFEWEGVTPETRLATMRTMKPTTKLGETFQYSNLMVAAGGYAAAHAFAAERPLAEAYAAAMRTLLFEPMGLASTTLDFATVERGEHARPHALDIGGATRVMPLAIERAVVPIAPAGAVWTTLHDMERYAQTELANGVAPGGQRVVSEAAMRDRATLRARVDSSWGYGLGLGVGRYSGLRALGHDGGSFGFGATMFLLPDEKVGIVILTNVRNGNSKEQLPFNAAVKRHIIEALFPSARPIAEQLLAYYKKLRAVPPHPTSSDRAWVKPLVGTYRHPTLGSVEIRETATGALLDAGEWSTAIDRIVSADGTASLLALDPPFAGSSAIVIGPGDPPTLLIPGQTTYTLTR